MLGIRSELAVCDALEKISLPSKRRLRKFCVQDGSSSKTKNLRTVLLFSLRNNHRFQHERKASCFETLDFCQCGWTYERKWCGYDAPKVFSVGAQCVSDDAPHLFESINSHLPFQTMEGTWRILPGSKWRRLYEL